MGKGQTTWGGDPIRSLIVFSKRDRREKKVGQEAQNTQETEDLRETNTQSCAGHCVPWGGGGGVQHSEGSGVRLGRNA